MATEDLAPRPNVSP